MKMFFFCFVSEERKEEYRNDHLVVFLFFFEIIQRMFRTILRYLTTTTKIPVIPKPLAPNKPKASIDFVSNE